MPISRKEKIMSQSSSQQLTHIIFSTKDRYPFLKNPIVLEKTHAYLQGICKNHRCLPVAIGGMEDHVHLFINLDKKISLSNFIEEVKKSSSRWIKTLQSLDGDLVKFYWQRGYGAFSVSQSNLHIVKLYIENQKNHHQKINYQDELRGFLNKCGIQYNEAYLWD
jgi:putative transposase